MALRATQMNGGLWIIQGLLAAIFLFAGSTKLILPVEVLVSMGSPNQIVLSGWFLKFIGVAEVLGAIGLILLRLPAHPASTDAAGCRGPRDRHDRRE